MTRPDINRINRALEVLRDASSRARHYEGIWSGWSLRDPSQVARSRRVALAFRTVGLIEHDRILRGAA